MKITKKYLDTFDLTLSLPIVRTKEVNDKYNKHKIDLEKTGVKLHEHVLENTLNDKEYIIAKNLYPYHLEKNLFHYVYWIHPDYPNRDNDIEIYNNINLFMKNNLFDGYWCWENNYLNKSIPEIKHYQIIFMRC